MGWRRNRLTMRQVPGAAPVVCGLHELRSKLGVQPQRHHRYRSSVAIVGWVIDPLIVDAQMRGAEDRERIIRFDDLLGTRTRQPTVADQNSESAGVQVAFARGGNAVVDRGKTQRVA